MASKYLPHRLSHSQYQAGATLPTCAAAESSWKKPGGDYEALHNTECKRRSTPNPERNSAFLWRYRRKPFQHPAERLILEARTGLCGQWAAACFDQCRNCSAAARKRKRPFDAGANEAGGYRGCVLAGCRKQDSASNLIGNQRLDPPTFSAFHGLNLAREIELTDWQRNGGGRCQQRQRQQLLTLYKRPRSPLSRVNCLFVPVRFYQSVDVEKEPWRFCNAVEAFPPKTEQPGKAGECAQPRLWIL